MKIIIQCAGRKRPDAGSLNALNGKRVMFVANPDEAPSDNSCIYARPDSPSIDSQTWREQLMEYNRKNYQDNPFGILPAYQLYMNAAYERLVSKFSQDRVYILSAGWGLIPANFLTPTYDITFSPAAQPYNRRKKKDQYQDFCMLPDDGDNLVFLGGKDYLPLFCALTGKLKGAKMVFFNSLNYPVMPANFKAVKYKTNTRTNWHYECANDLIEDRIS